MPCVPVSVRARLIALSLLIGTVVLLFGQCYVIAGPLTTPISPTGQSVTLGWSPIGGNDVAGYKIHYGTASHIYPNVVVAGNTNIATITGLVAGTTYYFAATSYNGAGVESPYSEEVSYTVSEPAAQLSAVVSSGGQFSFTVAGITGQTYVVQASTNLLDWVPVQTNAAPFVYLDTNTAVFKQRFYRAFNF